MVAAAILQLSFLDASTLAVVAVCLAALLGIFLLFAWLQQRSVRALAWWGSAYLVGASSIALWGTPSPPYHLPPEMPEALAFVACGMIWNGVRLFHDRPLMPLSTFAGAALWLLLCQLLPLPEGSNSRVALGVLVVAGYTFVIAFELGRERRKSLRSLTATIVVPSLHAAVFLTPLVMKAALPDASAGGWLTLFMFETIIYAVGAAFIVLLMVKDHSVNAYRTAANTDHLTGLLNRRAFMESALALGKRQGELGEPLTLMMFDLDHFKSINDRFGHAVGDDVLRVFSNVIRTSMRASDIVGRLGGEEFAAIVPEPMAVASRIAERLRLGFEAAGVTVGGHAIGASVSIGAATSYAPATDIDALLIRADTALYKAKHAGRNRLHAADDEPESGARTRQIIAAARDAKPAARGWPPRRKRDESRDESFDSTANG